MKSEYTQDVEFNSAFGSLQTPVHLYTASLLCGFKAPPITGHFRYLDIACGNGHTLALLADAYPLAEFVGIDINKAHIADARQRALNAGLSNLHFIEADIINIDASDFEPFNYCAISGVYSWLDAQRRIKLHAFIKEVVAPDGLVYLHYSSQPGMAQTAPLYQVLQRVGAGQNGSSGQKLTAATQVLDALRKKDARFFKQNPNASARLNGIINNPAEDEAHEVFNLQESGFWSSDVINLMQDHGFTFVGSSGLQHNVSSFTEHSRLPAECKNLSLPIQQMLQDVAWNTGQRKDLYIHKSHDIQQNDFDLLQELENMNIYAVPGALSLENRQRVSAGYPGVNFSSRATEIAAKVLQTATTFSGVFAALSTSGISRPESVQLVSNMLAARLVSIATRPMPDVQVADQVYMPSKLNRSILTEDIGFEIARPFASPVAGSKVALPIRDRLYLWLLINGDVGKAWDSMGSLKEAFRGEKNEALDRSAFVSVLRSGLPTFKKHAVPELMRLGILAAR